MNEIIKIKCPNDGAILKLKNQPDLDSKTVTCPHCQNKLVIGDCEHIEEKKDDDATLYGQKKKQSEDDTIVDPNPTVSAGRLVNTQTGSVYQLKVGRNTIGREVMNPLPTVTLPIDETKTHNTMSREHAIIEVTRLGNGSFRHFLFNWKNKNATCVDGMPLNEGDRVVLSHGQVISMGQVNLRFETK